MQAAAYLVYFLVKFSTGMEFCHDDLDSRPVQFRVDIDRYSSSIVAYRDKSVIVYDDTNLAAEASQCLVD